MTDTSLNINTSKDSNPLDIFDQWFEVALSNESIFPNACTLATLNSDGMPQARTVLLKGRKDNEFHFFTNYTSQKGKALIDHPKATMLFYWKSLQKQVRIEGDVTKLSPEDSQAYFATRPRGSQIGAWASQQSQPLSNRDELLERTKQLEEEFEGMDVPCPEHWGGFCLKPQRMEFWQLGEFRLHERCLFTFTSENSWDFTWLNP